MLKNEVISSFYNKGIKFVPIGPDLRYIGKLPTSRNHNFEEEYLLGEDKEIKRWYGVDSDNQPCYREEIKYGSSENGYYQLDYFEYDMRPMNQDVIYDNGKLTFDVHNKLENLDNANGNVLRKYNLYYHKNDQDELFSSKIVESRFIQDNSDPKKRKWIEIIKHPPIPTPVPDWWINSYETKPTYSLNGYEPYIQQGRYLQSYEIYADFSYSYSTPGGPNFCINGGSIIDHNPIVNYEYDIPLYDLNENLSTYKIKYVIGVESEIPNYRLKSGVLLYNGNTLIEQVGGINNQPIDDNIYKIMAYAGANRFNGAQELGGKRFVYGGLAIIMTTNQGFRLVHLGSAIDLNYLQQTYGVYLSSDWLTT